MTQPGLEHPRNQILVVNCFNNNP